MGGWMLGWMGAVGWLDELVDDWVLGWMKIWRDGWMLGCWEGG